MWNGRNFLFRQAPYPEHRLGRWVTGDAGILIGAPVVLDATAGLDENGDDGFGRSIVKLADGAQAPSRRNCGLLYWEAEYDGMRGHDPVLTREVDIDTCPANTPFQLIQGDEVRVWFKNTEANSVGPVGVGMANDYGARNMVKPSDLGATPTAVRGSFLTPAASPSDTNGFWQVTTNPTNAWLEITRADPDLNEVEAQFLF